jgi:NAD(P)-dependent dehydrogenase (short-subunit alcohol dehydrogenase family)
VEHRKVLETFRLDGRRALVTGGGRGLGLVMARALAEAGADVAIAGRSLETCEKAAGEIGAETGRTLKAFRVDVTQADQVTRLASEVAGGLGPIDILIKNAGNNTRGMIAELSEADWDSVIDTNLKGTFLCSKAFGPPMLERGWGRVINLGSILSFIGIPGRTPYASAKAGVANLTRVLALEWAGSGVTANAICPGPFGTDMNKPLLEDPEKYKAFLQQIPMGRWGDLDEMAGVAVFLASDASSFVTGSSIVIDGGWTAR